jgi:hypothetical protein
MKMLPQDYAQLRESIRHNGGLPSGATMRQRWDALYASQIDIPALYRAGLNDDHIDTALRHIAKESNQ